MKPKARSAFALRLALLYGLFGTLWILITDIGLGVLTGEPLQIGQTLKGFVFIGLTMILLYALISAERRHQAQTTIQLEKSEQRQRMVLAQMPLILWVTNRDLRIEDMIGGGVPMLEHPPEWYVGRTLFEVFNTDDPNVTPVAAHRHALQGISSRYELTHEGRYYDVRVEPLYDGKRHIRRCVSVATDLTERRQVEEAEREQRLLAEALQDTAAALTSTLDRDEVLQRILDHVARVVAYDAANIMLVDETDIVRVVKHRNYAERGLVDWIEAQRYSYRERSKMREMAETLQPVWVPDTHAYESWISTEQTRSWVHSYAAAPIHREGKLKGFLNLYSTTPDFFGQTEAERLRAFADQAGIALENAELMAATQEHARTLAQRVRERTAELQAIKDRTEAILDSSGDMIALVHADGTVAQANTAFRQAFGTQPDTQYPQAITAFISPDDTDQFRQHIEHVIAEHVAVRFEVTACPAHMPCFDADVILTPVIASQSTGGAVCNIRDVSEQKQMEHQLQLMLEREIELSETRLRFVSMASHEFRTPLTVIQSTCDLLHKYYDKLSPDKIDDKYRLVRNQIHYLTGLLDEVLLYIKSEVGQIRFEPEQANLGDLCREIISDLRQAIGANHVFEFQVSDSIPPVYVDRRLLHQLLSNLVSNAVKYSPPETTITITVAAEPQRHEVRLSVADQGRGIPAEDQPRLFEAFHRASNVDDIPGTGLGLAIVRRTVQLHHGRITFESVEDRGTTFNIFWPEFVPEKEKNGDLV